MGLLIKLHKNSKDETGKIYGRLTVLSPAKSIPHTNGSSMAWLCQCSCGKKSIRIGSHLRKGCVKSCGCLAIESQKNTGKKNHIHGTNKIRVHAIGTPKKRAVFLNNFKSKYGLLPEIWDELILKSEGLCGICSNGFKNKSQDCNVDHNHKTGKVRGLLCQRCNMLLAGLEDKEFCIKATLYLQEKDGD
jgi:hypothetical protein